MKYTSVEIVVHEDAFDSIYGKNGCNLARLKEVMIGKRRERFLELCTSYFMFINL